MSDDLDEAIRILRETYDENALEHGSVDCENITQLGNWTLKQIWIAMEHLEVAQRSGR